MQKNVASQKWIVFAFDETDNTAKTGDAANITAEMSKDGAAGGGNITDTNPTELEDGYYVFDIAQGESNADLCLLLPESSTVNIQVIACPAAIYTTEPNRNKLSVDSNGRIDIIKFAGTTQTAGDIVAAIITNAAGVDIAADIIAVKAETVTILTDTSAQDTATKLRTLLTGVNTPVCKDSTPLSAAQVNTEVDTALADIDLDHLLKTATAIPSLTAGTFFDQIRDDGSATFNRATDSLQAIRDRGDSGWPTATGFSTHDAAAVKTTIEANGSKIDHLWETTEDDAGVRRFTTNALEQAPSGTGGDATAANQTTIINSLLGPGDYTVTLTIRTVTGTPVSGITVWLNTSNVRSTSIAGSRVTDVNGQVEFELDYTTYYIFCNLSGYTFASASFTASDGNVAFTKDIGTVVSAGSSAFYSDSFLSRAIVDVRESTDEPSQTAKYSDSRIIEQLEKAYIIVLNEINRNSRTPAVAKINKTIASGITTYPIPHTMGSIHGIYKGDSSGGKVFYDSRSKFNAFGRGIWIENQTLHIQTTDMYGIGTEVTIEYVPSGIARLHNGICTINTDGDVVTFGATPNAGALDTHNEAYAGSIFRCLGVDGSTITGNYLQERVITAYDETTREATLDSPLSPIPTTDDGSIYYEIAPAISKGMDTVVALYTAWRITSIEGNVKRASSILKAYRNEIRNVRLTAYYSYLPEAPIDRSDSGNNRRYLRF